MFVFICVCVYIQTRVYVCVRVFIYVFVCVYNGEQYIHALWGILYAKLPSAWNVLVSLFMVYRVLQKHLECWYYCNVIQELALEMGVSFIHKSTSLHWW